MRPGRCVVVLLALAAGCSLAARDHACWPYLQHQYRGHVPPDLVRTLAHEHGTRKQVRDFKAPVGWYWRRASGSLDLEDVRRVSGGYELRRCPVAALQPSWQGAALPRRR
jgi:hypothetical protein